MQMDHYCGGNDYWAIVQANIIEIVCENNEVMALLLIL